MKVKHLERGANVAWSPKSQHPILLAAGTAAQQLDASFNSSAALEVYSLNLREPGPDLELKGTAGSEHRFHKIAWSDHGSGTIIGGCDGGFVNIYSASKILNGEDGLLKTQNKHIGPVHALDVNPFQQNLFATGASESEIYIWDLNNVTTHMSPGAKTQPLEDVLSVAWNRQVQHILSSTFASKCVIWDLRKNEPIIKLTDTVSRVRWKDAAWHPEVATQLCLASEEDHSPIIQVWDLRFATSPLKSLEHHQRGVLSIAWCQDDADLLVSSGKDNFVLCWNPNSSKPEEDLSEIAHTNQWIFDIAWCPRNPALVACPSFDGHVAIYSLMGGKTQQVQTSSKIADSFPGMDGYVQAPAPQQVAPASLDLIKPPKWLKRPVGASFGFGGRLITFGCDKSVIAEIQHHTHPGQPVALTNRTVEISQVITEPELVQHSTYLEQALHSGQFKEYCIQKAEETNDQHKKYIWHFLKAYFDENPRAELLNLLGYRIEDVNNKLNQFIGKDLKNNIDGLVDQLSNMNRIEDFEEKSEPFKLMKPSKPVQHFKIKTGDDIEGLITQALLLGNVEAAVELCFKAKRFADAIIIAMTGGSDLLARTQDKYLEQSEGYVSSLISALVLEDWGSIVNHCDTSSWKEALAATLTHSSDDELPLLCEQLGSRLESSTNNKLAQDAQLCYICSGNFEKLVNSWIGNTTSNTKDLQELVELVSFLQKAVERQGRQVQIRGALADLLSHYASILAAQGNLSAALTYLGYSDDPKVVTLRDRLLVSLGQKPAYNLTTRRSTVGYGDTSRFPYKTQFAGVTHQPTLQGQAPLPGSTPTFNTGLPNSGSAYGQVSQTVQPVQPVRTFSPVLPPLTQPPRPSSVSSNQGSSGGLPSRKYVLDPSVSSSPYGSNLMQPNQYQHMSSVPTYQSTNFQPLQGAPMAPTAPASSIQQSNMFSPPSFTAQPTSMAPPPSMAAPSPMVPPPPISAVPPLPLTSRFSRAGSRTQSFSETDGLPDGYSGTGQLPYSQGIGDGYINGKLEQAQSALNAFNAMNNAPSGWNDPPICNRTRVPQYAQTGIMSAEHAGTRKWKNKSSKQTAYHPSTYNEPKPERSSQEPITHPLYGAVPAQNSSNPPSMGYPLPGQQFNTPLGSTAFGQDLSQGLPNSAPPTGHYPTTFNPTNFNQNAVNPGAFNQVSGGGTGNGVYGQGGPHEGVEAPQSISKPPIPEEHVHMKSVFDALREKCSCTANNPQMKRKLEDVGRKLEILYDLLREQRLSPNTLTNLHQLVGLIQQGNYNAALQLYTQLASGPDFAQIASFMPGIKILLTCASQLQVFLS